MEIPTDFDDDPFEEAHLHRNLSSSRIRVPAELVPSLQRMQSSDVLNFASEKAAVKNHSRLYSTIHHPGFDRFMGIVILLNVVVMVIETDMNAKQEEETDANVIHWTGIFGWVVLGIFAVELMMRLIVFKCSFFRDSWNVFDFTIVFIDLVFSIVGLIANDSSLPVSILRIFRLGKLTRAFKVLRVFPELRLLLAGVVSCLSAIWWGSVLLFFFLLVWGLMAVSFIHPLNKEIEYGEGCERCSRAYSSVLQAMLSFWAQIVTGDSWGQTTIPVIEKHPSTAFFFIPMYVSVGMAITNLILGVVVNVAQRSQDSLQEEDQKEKALHKLEARTHLLQLCREMDSDNNGELSKEELFSELKKDGEFRETIMSLDIAEDEFDIVWKVIDADQKGFVSYKALVNALSSMKASDIQFMLSYIKYYMTMLKHSLVDKIDNAGQKIETEEKKVMEEMTTMMGMEQSVREEILKVEKMIEQSVADVHGDATSGDVSKARMTSSPGEPHPVKQNRSGSADSECAKPSRADDMSEGLLEQIHDDVASLQTELRGMFTDMTGQLHLLGAQQSSRSKCNQTSGEAEGSRPWKREDGKFDKSVAVCEADPAVASSWSYTNSKAQSELIVVPEKKLPSRWCCPASRERCVVHVEMQRDWPSDQETTSLPQVPVATEEGSVSPPQVTPGSLDGHV